MYTVTMEMNIALRHVIDDNMHIIVAITKQIKNNSHRKY